jgi:hypothetical protein
LRAREKRARIDAEVRARLADILGQCKKLGEHDRSTLVRVLGMLGSSSDNEVLVAGRKAEALRQRLGLTWDDLIVAAAEGQRRAAA